MSIVIDLGPNGDQRQHVDRRERRGLRTCRHGLVHEILLANARHGMETTTCD